MLFPHFFIDFLSIPLCKTPSLAPSLELQAEALVDHKTLQAHRPPGMDPVRGDAHFGPETIPEAVREARGAVVVHASLTSSLETLPKTLKLKRKLTKRVSMHFS